MRITVKPEAGKIVTYDPGRASGVDTFEQRLQEFSAGERVQFLTKDKKLGTNTRDTGTLRSLDQKGNAELVLDRNNRVLKFNLQNHRQINHAYSMTSHSAQSKTVKRVLVNIDTSDSRLRGLINQVFGYVGTSRAEYDIQVYADDRRQLARVLSRKKTKSSRHCHRPRQRAIKCRLALLSPLRKPLGKSKGRRKRWALKLERPAKLFTMSSPSQVRCRLLGLQRPN